MSKVKINTKSVALSMKIVLNMQIPLLNIKKRDKIFFEITHLLNDNSFLITKQAFDLK
jgi:hypothetical protein